MATRVRAGSLLMMHPGEHWDSLDQILQIPDTGQLTKEGKEDLLQGT